MSTCKRCFAYNKDSKFHCLLNGEINELRDQEDCEELKTYVKNEYPKINYDSRFDILYIDFKPGYGEAEFISSGIYVRYEMDTNNVIGFHIEGFFDKCKKNDFILPFVTVLVHSGYITEIEDIIEDYKELDFMDE